MDRINTIFEIILLTDFTSNVKNALMLLEKGAVKKLDMINFVTGLEQLRIPPGNRLEKLSGDLAGFYSIRINDQFRIIFKWIVDHAYEVQLIDYH